MAEEAQFSTQAFAHVRVGECDVAIPIAHVRQALFMQNLTVLPRRASGLLGLAVVDGATVPVVALDRWLPIGASTDKSERRLFVLEQDGAVIGIQVDAVLGVRVVNTAAIRRVHQVPVGYELFDSVIPETSNVPTLCILEVARLMQLTEAWCRDIGREPVRLADSTELGGASASNGNRHALFQIGTEQWAVEIQSVFRVLPIPKVELSLGRYESTWAISQVEGRKLPLVDISTGHQASSPEEAPWMAVLGSGSLILGLTVAACKQFVDITEASLAKTPGAVFLKGVVVLPGIGKVNVLDVEKLFLQVSLTAISQSNESSSSAADIATAGEISDPSPYMVFEADQRYASPITGVLGLVELPQQARDDLRNGQPAVLSWRGKTLPLFNLPSFSSRSGSFDPTLAVLVQPPEPTSQPVGIAIKQLTDWLPAYSAKRRDMRMNSMGEFCMINAQGNPDMSGIVVVELAQMAHLLG